MNIKFVSLSDNWTLEDATDHLSPNVGKKLTNFTSDVSVFFFRDQDVQEENPFYTSWPVKRKPTRCPENVGGKPTYFKIPEERRFLLHFIGF